jgi:hypothetical protein
MPTNYSLQHLLSQNKVFSKMRAVEENGVSAQGAFLIYPQIGSRPLIANKMTHR